MLTKICDCAIPGSTSLKVARDRTGRCESASKWGARTRCNGLPRAYLGNPGPGSVHQQGLCYPQASHSYLRAIQLRETLGNAHWGAATSFEMLGERDRMRAYAIRFLVLRPESPYAPAARTMTTTP